MVVEAKVEGLQPNLEGGHTVHVGKGQRAGRGQFRGRRGWLVAGAALSAVLLVCSMVVLVMQDDGPSSVELAGKYDYGRYTGLAPDKRLAAQIREDPHGLVYYNVFTDKAVSPHRWLSANNFRSVLRKALAVIAKLKGEEVAKQDELNQGFLKRSGELESRMAQVKEEAKDARAKAERELKRTIVSSVAVAEEEGVRKLDMQKRRLKELLTKKSTLLNKMLAQSEKAANSRLRALRKAIKANEVLGASTEERAKEGLSRAEDKLSAADKSNQARIASLGKTVHDASNTLDEQTEALEKDLLKAKLALSKEVDGSVAKLKVKLNAIIVEMRVVLVRYLKESQARSRSRIGQAGAAINSRYNRVKKDLSKVAAKEGAFHEAQRMALDRDSKRAKALESSVDSGRLRALDRSMKALVKEMGRSIAKLRAEQKAGALFLEQSADKVLGGMRAQLSAEQKGDMEAMVHAREQISKAQRAMAHAVKGSYWRNRYRRMTTLRSGLSRLLRALKQIRRFRSIATSQRSSAVRRAERSISHGFVAQFWWREGAGAKQPSLYSPPDRQVLAEVVDTSVARAGQGREQAGRSGMPTGEDIGLFARYFGLFDAPVSGEYEFFVGSSGEAQLWIDTKEVVSVSSKVAEVSGKMTLDAGPHTLWVEHTSVVGAGKLNVDWKGPGVVRQVLNGWHSAPEPGWQAQVYFWGDKLEKMPNVKGVLPDREGVTTVLDYEGWSDWNRAMVQEALVAPPAKKSAKPKAIEVLPAAKTGCVEASRSPLEAIEGDGASCKEGVLASFTLSSSGCKDKEASHASFTCLDVPVGSCAERIGVCQDYDAGPSAWEASCGAQEAMSAIRVHSIGCKEGQRRLAWKCCLLSGGAYDKERKPTVEDAGCQAVGDKDGGIGATCSGGKALESWSATKGRCGGSDSLSVVAKCAGVPREVMPVGRVAARFWGFMKRAGYQRVRLGTESAGGSKIVVDGRTLVDNDGLHGKKTAKRDLTLGSGGHIVQAQYFQDKGPEILRVWQSNYRGHGRSDTPLKVWHYAPPAVPSSLAKSHLAGGVLMFLGNKHSFIQQKRFVRMPRTSFTLAAWVLPASGKGGEEGQLVSYGRDGGPLLAGIGRSGSLTATVMGTVVDTGITIAEGRWRHVGLSWSKGNGRLVIYLDGDPLIVKLNVGVGKNMPNGGCIVIGQAWTGMCGKYEDKGAFEGNMADIVIGRNAWSGTRMRRAMTTTHWRYSSRTRDTAWAITRHQASPRDYVSGLAKALCSLDSSPLANWRKGRSGPCPESVNVQWREPSGLRREQATRNRGPPRVMMLTGHGRAAVVRQRLTSMPGKQFTVTLWVKVLSGKEDGVLLSYGQADGAKKSAPLLQVGQPSSLKTTVLGATVKSLLDVSDGEWHHVGLTWDSKTGEAVVFIEGKALLTEPNVAAGETMPNGGCLALGVSFGDVCGSAVPAAADKGSGFVGQMQDVMVYKTILSEGYLRAIMHSEMPSMLGRAWLRLAVTGRQYGDRRWLPIRPREVRSMRYPSCARHGGLRSFFFSAGTYKTTSECRFRCTEMVGDYVVVRSMDRHKSLEVQARMVGVKGQKLSFPDAVGVDYRGDQVTAAGGATGTPYYIMRGRAVTKFPAVSRRGIRMYCAKGDLPGCAVRSTKVRVIQIYVPDGTLVTFWNLRGLWGGYEVQMPLNCYSNKIEGLAGTMSVRATDFAKGGKGAAIGKGAKFDALKGKCAAKGPLSKEMGGMFDSTSGKGSDVSKWCQSWKVGSKKVIANRHGRKGSGSISVNRSPKLPFSQSCVSFASRPAWYEACKGAEKYWGASVGAESMFVARGVTQEMRSTHANPRAIIDSSGSGQTLEGRGVRLGGDGRGLVNAKRSDPEDLDPFVVFPERLGLWSFSAQAWKLSDMVKDPGVSGAGIVCMSLGRDACPKHEAGCRYSVSVGCIPASCDARDVACIRKGGKFRAGTAEAVVPSGPPGYCSKWYENPLGGRGIRRMPDLRKLEHQKAVVVPSVDFENDKAFTKVTGIAHFDRVAMTLDGILTVTKAGDYRVCTRSDDGSHVWIDGAKVAASPGLHGPRTGCGTAFLSKGNHGVYVAMFENGGGAYERVTYQGPDTKGREVLLPSIGFQGACEAVKVECQCGVGYCGRFYYNPFGPSQVRDFPDFTRLIPQVARTVLSVGFSNQGQMARLIGKGGHFDRVAVSFSGVLHINVAGQYTVCTTSDDGSRVFIDGIKVGNNPGLHGMRKRCGKMQLDTGDHSSRIEFFENGGGAGILVRYKGPDTAGREVLMPSSRMLICRDEDREAAEKARAVAAKPKPPPKPVKSKGWCSRWYFNPLGGRGIGRMPDLRRLTPQRVEVVPEISFKNDAAFTAVTGTKHFDRVALTLDGSIEIRLPGEYRLCTRSDDGSYVYIDGQEMAKSPGLHGPRTGCGARYLAKGEHSVLVKMFENGGGAYETVTYSGPDTDGKLVLMKSSGYDGPCKVTAPECDCQAGWCNLIYLDPNGPGQVRDFPNFRELTPQKAKVSMTIGFRNEHYIKRMINSPGRLDHVAIAFHGVLHINFAGEYKVCSTSDDGSRVYVNGVLVANNPGLHGARRRCGKVQLSSDNHDISGHFFENGGGSAIIVTYSGPDTGGRAILMPSVSACKHPGGPRSVAVVRPSVPRKREGPTGWCSKWFENPLGGHGIGRWPDVSKLSPQKAVILKTVDLTNDKAFMAVTGKKHFDRVAMTVDGTLEVSTPGDYRVCTRSDDGSHVYVDGAKISASPGLHGPRTGCGNRYLSSGDHTVLIHFFENGGGAYEKVTYSGPDTGNKFKVMPSVGFQGICDAPKPVCDCTSGWCMEAYYDPNGAGQVRDFPKFDKLVPQRARVINTIGFWNDHQIATMLGKRGRFDHVGVTFSGVLHINFEGQYTICTRSDDGSRMFIDDKLQANNPGLHGARTRCSKAMLSSGLHNVRVEFFENGGGAMIRVTYRGPDTGNKDKLMPSSSTCKSMDLKKIGSVDAAAKKKREGPSGYCAKFYENPLGGRGIGRMPALWMLNPQKAVIIPTIRQLNTADFKRITGLADFGRTAVSYDGTLEVLTPGDYRVCTRSDDGSHVYVDGAKISASPGLHGPRTGCGNRYLTRGDHTVLVTMFQNLGGAYEKVTYSGPDTDGKEVLMPSVGFEGKCEAPRPECGCGAGWCGVFYYDPNGMRQVRDFPDFSKLVPQLAKRTMTIGFHNEWYIARYLGKVGRVDHVAAQFFGVLRINAPGTYTMCTRSDDGSRIFVDGRPSTSNPGLHGPRRRCASLYLGPGDHSVRVEFFENGGGSMLRVQYSGPDTGGREQYMPSSSSCREPDMKRPGPPGPLPPPPKVRAKKASKWCTYWYYNPNGVHAIHRYPDTRKLTPQKAVVVSSVDFTHDNAFKKVVGLAHFDRVAISFHGTLHISIPGHYRVCTRSDDGSYVYVDGTQIAARPGLHPPQSGCGSRYLSRGDHTVRAAFFENGGGAYERIRYSGPDTDGKQVLMRSDGFEGKCEVTKPECFCGIGWCGFFYYNPNGMGQIRNFPDFSKIIPQAALNTGHINFRNDHIFATYLKKIGGFDKVGAVFKGMLHINKAGSYNLCTTSDDGSRMYVDGKRAANNPGLHGPRKRCARRDLSAGEHAMRVEFFENGGGAMITATYSGPDTHNREVMMPSASPCRETASRVAADIPPEVEKPVLTCKGGSARGYILQDATKVDIARESEYMRKPLKRIHPNLVGTRTLASFIHKMKNPATAFVVIPEQEKGHLVHALSAKDRRVMREYVNMGGTMVVAYAGNRPEIAMMNAVFGWKLKGQYCSSTTLNPELTGTCYDRACKGKRCASLPSLNAIRCVDKDSIMRISPQAKIVYSRGRAVSVWEVPVGSGKVVGLAPDWYATTHDWNTVLQIATYQGAGLAPKAEEEGKGVRRLGGECKGGDEQAYVLQDATKVDIARESEYMRKPLVAVHPKLKGSKTLKEFIAKMTPSTAFVVIPEQEKGRVLNDLSSHDRHTMKKYVQDGGILVVAYAGNSAEVAMMNAVFGWSLVSQGCGSTKLDAGAAGTCYDKLCKGKSCANLPSLNAIRCVRKDTVTKIRDAKVMYTSGNAASVFEIPFGRGKVVGLAPDWYATTSDWDKVLQAATYGSTRVAAPAGGRRGGEAVCKGGDEQAYVLQDATKVDIARESEYMRKPLVAVHPKLKGSKTLKEFIAKMKEPTTAFAVIPEQEKGHLVHALSSGDRATMKTFVEKGGILVVAYAGNSPEIAMMNAVFGWSLSGQGCGSTKLDAGAAGTCYDKLCKGKGCASLPSLNAIRCVRKDKIMAIRDAKVMFSSGNAASVFEIPFGEGKVVGLAPDWYATTSDWDKVLQAATYGSTRVPLKKPSGGGGECRGGTDKAYVLQDATKVDIARESEYMRKPLVAVHPQLKGSKTLRDFMTKMKDPSTAFVVIPEQEKGRVLDHLSSGDRHTMKKFVQDGGTLVVAYAGNSPEVSMMNAVFGWSLVSQGCGSTKLDAGAAGTCYDKLCKGKGCASLPSLNAIRCVRKDKIMAIRDAKVIYSHGNAASVFEIPVGEGKVVGLAPDWYATTSDWDKVLQAATYGTPRREVAEKSRKLLVNKIVREAGTPKGWCTKWYEDPLGGAALRGFPDIRKTNPQKALVVPTVYFTSDSAFKKVAGIKHFDRVAMTIEGILEIKRPGTYKLCTTSDDGSFMWIDGSVIAQAPGLHPPRTGCGSKFLSKGDHGVYTTFFENGGGAYETLRYQGPDTKNKLVPMPSAGFPGICEAPRPECRCGTGWCSKFYFNPNGHAQVRDFAKLDKLNPNEAKTTEWVAFHNDAQLSHYIGKLGRFDRVAASFTGVLHINLPGTYKLCTTSDDGSRLFVNGRQAVWNGGLHGARTRCADRFLREGEHDVRAEFFENGGGANILLRYQGPDTKHRLIYMPSSSSCKSAKYESRKHIAPIPIKRDGAAGYCSRWFFSPIGSHGISRFPDLRGLEPQKAVVVSMADWENDRAFTKVVGLQHFDRVAMTLDGILSVKRPGLYTLCTRSDDGSHIYVDGRAVARSPGLHGPRTGCGRTFVSKGDHLVYVTFFENGGGAYEKVTYSGPDTADRFVLMPSAGFEGKCEVHVPECPCGAGWCAEYYIAPYGMGQVRDFPDFDKLTPQKAVNVMSLNFPNEHYIRRLISFRGGLDRVAVVYTGVLVINLPGEYRICTLSDDGSRLFIDGHLSANNPGLHGRRRRCHKNYLLAGDHDVRVEFFENGGHANLLVVYTGPDTKGRERVMPSTSSCLSAKVAKKHAKLKPVGPPEPVCKGGVEPGYILQDATKVDIARESEYMRKPLREIHPKLKGSKTLKEFIAKMKEPTTAFAVIPEQEKGHIVHALSAGDRATMKTFVEKGGILVVAYAGNSPEIAMMNAVFGWSLSGQGCSTTYLTAEAKHTCYDKLCRGKRCARLPYLNAIRCVRKDRILSTAVGAKVIYSHGNAASVFEIPVGKGKVVGLAPDWYATTHDWNKVLQASTFVGAESPKVDMPDMKGKWCSKWYENPLGGGHIRRMPDIERLKLVPQKALEIADIGFLKDADFQKVTGIDHFDRVAMTIEGIFKIEIEGQYTFCVRSDDGSHFYVDGDIMAKKPGLHPPRTGCGKRWLSKGEHSSLVLFFENGGGAYLKLTYSGPDTGFREALLPSVGFEGKCEAPRPECECGTGFCFKAYYDPNGRHQVRDFPDLSKLVPQVAVRAPTIGLYNDHQIKRFLGKAGRFDRVAASFTGVVFINLPGQYDICTTSDDGSRLFLDGKISVNNGGLHGPRRRCSKALLMPGEHDVCVEFFENGGGAMIRVMYKGPDTKNRLVLMPSTSTCRKASQRTHSVALAIPKKRSGPSGWCAKWYLNPLGSAVIRSLPQLNRISPQRSSVVPRIDFTSDASFKGVVGDKHWDRVALTVSGTVEIMKPGVYKMCTTSDDGSRVYVDGEEMTSRPGYHKRQTKCGRRYLSSGDHSVLVNFFENGRGAYLKVTYNGPDTSGVDAVVPSVGFQGDCEVEAPKCSCGYGWCMEAYYDPNGRHQVRDFPDFSKLVPQAAKTTLTIGFHRDHQLRHMFSDNKLGRFDHVAMVFTGVVMINMPGRYEICDTSDDGSNVYIDGKLLVENGGLHAPRRRCRPVMLAQGEHDARVTFFENGGGAAVIVTYKGPDTNNRHVYMPSTRHSCPKRNRDHAKEKDLGGLVLKREGPKGYCSRWYADPLGGHHIRSFPRLAGLSPQKALVVADIAFTHDRDFTKVTGITHFDRVAVTFDGTLAISKTGMYTVCTRSDDGSHVYVDGFKVAARPGLHPPRTGCGDKWLSRGLHSVLVTMFENGGGAYQRLTYKGPDTGGSEVLMPSVGFEGECEAPVPKCDCGPGWCANFYYNPTGLRQVRDFPDFKSLVPQAAKTLLSIGYHNDGQIARMLGKKGRFDKVAATFDGVLHINSPGDYRICTVSDDGSRMLVDGRLTANNPGLHPPRRRCSKLSLASGDHAVRVEFFENYGGAAIIVVYSGPDTRNRERLMPSSRHACDSAPIDADGEAAEKPKVAPAPALPPPLWVGGSPQGWSFLPNDRIRLNGFPLTWAAALRNEEAPTRMLRIRIRSEDVYVSNSFVGVAFLATDVSNLEAIVFRRAVRGKYAYVYHLVISKGRESWSKPARAYLPSRHNWFRVSVDLVKRRLLVNHRRVALDLGFPQMEGTKVGVIGKGKSWDWEWLKTESGGKAGREGVKDLPVGAMVSLSSVLQRGRFVRARGESTGLLTVTIVKGDVTTVEPKPKLAVSVSVNGRSYRTDEVSGTSKPKWGASWEAPLPCRSLDDKMTFTLWDGKKKLGKKSMLVRTVEGSETKLKLRIAGKGAGGVITVEAKFECVRMSVESAAVRGGNTDMARESSFRVVPGLADSEDVSFESVAFPQMYLARDGEELTLARLPGRTSMEKGLVLYLYTVASSEDLDRAMNKGPDALRDTAPGAQVLVDSLKLPKGVSAHFPAGWEVDAGDKVVGVVRGMVDCRDSGDFTFKVARGVASVFVDGDKLPAGGKVKLVKGLHDIAVVAPSGKAVDVTWEGPLTKLDSVPGWHAASLPSAASMSGFSAAATFDVTKGEGKAKGTVVFGLEGDEARAVRVKSNGDVWVCSIQGHMRQLARGLRAQAYFVPKEMGADGGMPDFDYLAPNLVGSTSKMSFGNKAAMEKSVGSCRRPGFKQSPAPKMPGGSSAPAALCTGLRKKACKAIPTCRHETACGCIPRSCDCGESRCIKAGGKARMREMDAQILAEKPGDGSVGRRSHMHPKCGKGKHLPASGLGLVSKGYLSASRSGTHRFKVIGTGLAQLWVDGQLVCDKTGAKSVVAESLKLSKGSHKVVLMWYQGTSESQSVTAMWRRPGSRSFSSITGQRWQESRLSSRRRAYGALYDDAERSASFLFRRALYVPPPPPPGSVGPGSKAASLIPRGPVALASLACGSYLVAPAKDQKARARLLGKCKSDDEATRGSKECEFVDEHGFCYKDRYQVLCRAHRDQVRCMTSVPSPEYKLCKCNLIACTCDKAPEPADHPNIMSPMPLEDDVGVLKIAEVAAWKFVGARNQIVSRCRAEVEVAYVEVLKRPVDPTGLVHFTRQCLLDFGKNPPAKPVSSMRRAIKKSLPALSPFGKHEYKDWVKARKVVIAAMRDVMLREPADTVELHRYAVKVKQGASKDNVAAILGFSDEYIKLRSDREERLKRAEAMVVTVYREVLMRPATRFEVVTYAKKIVAKTLKVSVLAKDLKKGGECRRMCGDRKAVRPLYQDYVLREPDAGGFKWWVDRVHRKITSIKALHKAFLVCAEYVHLRVNVRANVRGAVRHLSKMLESLDKPRVGKGPGRSIK